MANALDCPEDANSTDCLLRILIQKIDDHFEEYDWGPITFAFTVPIGFIATLFAAFTIYQAIRTTSRGSRKSNRRAIGEWSCKTTKKWDWHELALISTVRTPTLTTSNVMEALERETPPQASNPQQAPSSSEASNTQEALAKLRKFLLWPFYGTARQDSQKIQSEDPSIASWLGFLAELGLCHSDLPKIRLKNTIADYLPDDLLAAPAYGEVGFIVAAAAAAGAHSWQIDKQWGYPIVMGHSFQFEFRSHPTLGMIGAFVKWNDSPRNRHMLTGRQLKIALLQARGDLDVSAPPSNDFTEGSNEFERLNFLGDSGKGLISHLSSKVVGLNHDCKHGLCWCDELFFAREDQHHLMWFFMASTPSRPPYIFPSKLVRNSNAFKFLALHSNFWASLKTKDLFASVNSKSEAPEFSSSEEWYTKDLPTTIMEGDLDRILKFLDEHTGESKKGTGRGLIPFDLPASTFNNQDCICVFRVVLGPSINFLYDTNEFGTWFNGLKELKQEYFRVLILLQLMQINQWLATRDQEEVMCAIVSLSTTTLALLDMNSSLSNESFGFSSPKEKPIVGVDEDGGDSYLEDDISFPYMRMLQTLGHLLSEVGYFEPDNCHKVSLSYEQLSSWYEQAQKHSVPLGRLTHLTPHQSISHVPELISLLEALSKVLEGHRTSLKFNKDYTEAKQKEQEKQEKKKLQRQGQEPKGGGRKPEGEGQDPQGEEQELVKTAEETVRDLLIWRCILTGMLFSTAPDNSDLLSSGMWERIVPIV